MPRADDKRDVYELLTSMAARALGPGADVKKKSLVRDDACVCCGDD
jgi:hypothetical protein